MHYTLGDYTTVNLKMWKEDNWEELDVDGRKLCEDTRHLFYPVNMMRIFKSTRMRDVSCSTCGEDRNL